MVFNYLILVEFGGEILEFYCEDWYIDTHNMFVVINKPYTVEIIETVENKRLIQTTNYVEEQKVRLPISRCIIQKIAPPPDKNEPQQRPQTTEQTEVK